MPSLEEQFSAFSKFGNVRSDGKTITLTQIDKWMKQAGVFDRKTTTTDTSIHFKKLQTPKLTYTNFNKFLRDLATAKAIDLNELKNKMASCGVPGALKPTIVRQFKSNIFIHYNYFISMPEWSREGQCKSYDRHFKVYWNP